MAGGIELKTPDEIAFMREAALITYEALEAMEKAVTPGISLEELDAIGERATLARGGICAFKGLYGFPKNVCISVNEQVVHGIPAASQVLADGDLISVDCGAILNGWHGDSAVTLAVGTVSDADLALSAATRECMYAGIAVMRPGAKLTDISFAIESKVHEIEEATGVEYGIVPDYGGHGIGTSMHMEPFLPNYGKPGRGPKLRTGMAIAVEPMLTTGTEQTLELEDGWTVVTQDGGRAAHWEHSVAITDNGPWILTAPEDAD